MLYGRGVGPGRRSPRPAPFMSPPALRWYDDDGSERAAHRAHLRRRQSVSMKRPSPGAALHFNQKRAMLPATPAGSLPPAPPFLHHHSGRAPARRRFPRPMVAIKAALSAHYPQERTRAIGSQGPSRCEGRKRLVAIVRCKKTSLVFCAGLASIVSVSSMPPSALAKAGR